MKKQLLFLFFALLALCASAAVGDNFTNGKLRYEVMSNGTSTDYGTVAVKGLSSEGASYSSLDLQIPGLVTYNGASYKVVKVWASAFNGSSNLTYVRMLYGMEDVSVAAFRNCTKLQSVKLPSSLKVIRKNAFENCSVLRSVYYANPTPDNSTIDETAFPNNSSMQLIVPLTDANSVENAKKVTAFNKFSNIYAHHQAFDFVFGNGAYCCVTKAPANKNVSGEFSIVGIDPLNLVFSPTSSSENIVGYNFNYAIIVDGAYASKSLKTVDLSKLDYLKMVGQSAFEDCKALTSVQLGTGLINIRPYAFRNCTSLKSITLPASVRVCSAYFVDGCSNMQTIGVDGTNNYFASYAGILYNKALTELIRCPEGYKLATEMHHVFFPAAFKTIGPYAFENCKLIKEIFLPYGTTGFGRGAFNKCTALTAIQIPSSLKDWGEYAFSGTTALDKMYVGFSDAPSLPADYFKDCRKRTLYRAGVESTGFQNEPWTSWRKHARGGFDFISTSNSNLNSLRYAILSDKQETVHGKQFDGKAAVTYVPDPAVTGSSEIVVPAYITLRNGKKYAVTEIGNRVCDDGMNAKATFTLGEHVESVYFNAFDGQTNLIGLKMNANLRKIGNNAFRNCNIANDIILPYGIEFLGDYAFSNNPFKRIRIPSSIQILASNAFINNGNLQEIILNSSVFSDVNLKYDFTGIPSSCKVYVPQGCYDAYKNNQNWGKFTISEGAYDFTFRNLDDKSTYYHITVTKKSTFTKDGLTYSGTAKYVYHPSHSNLSTSLFVASNYETDETYGANKKYLMTEIGDCALWKCPRITLISIKDMKSLNRIGTSAFQNTSIEKFTVPSYCETIGKNAFVDCKKLTELFIEDGTVHYWYGRFYGNNAANFVCYVVKEKYPNWARSISEWTLLEGETVKPVDRLNAYLLINGNSTVVPFSVDHPVDWNASGLNAYTIYSYQKSEQMAYAQQVAATPAGTGLLIDGYSKGVIYKLQRPKATPPMPTNLLVGNPNEVVDVFNQSVGYLFSPNDKYFWKPTSSYRLSKGYAYLKVSPALAGSTTEINIDLWAKATGDINGDGEVNVSDVTALINKILGSSTYTDAVCDINGDGEINVSDVTALINAILK